MNFRQKMMKFLYPLIMKVGKKKPITGDAKPLVPFYDLKAQLNNGKEFSFEELKNKNVLIVNTASNCGFTAQYAELEKLHSNYKHDLVILGFPANDFKEQEKDDDATIAQFCQINFGVTFPLMKKTVVLKKEDQHQVYQWLTDAAKNGWNTQEPTWNFSKYLINKEGTLTHFFTQNISPLDTSITTQL
jgi:glutathione peroxidase